MTHRIARRALLLGAAALTGRAQSGRSAKQVLQQDLPPLALDGFQMTAVEVTLPPGVVSPPHRHPNFVLGYVLEGEMRFQCTGQAERVIPAGGMFYEPPGGIHEVAASASPTRPVRFLALLFHPKGATLTTPAG